MSASIQNNKDNNKEKTSTTKTATEDITAGTMDTAEDGAQITTEHRDTVRSTQRQMTAVAVGQTMDVMLRGIAPPPAVRR